MKAVAFGKLNAAKITHFVYDGVENIEGKEENTGYLHFFLFPPNIQMAFSFRVVISS